MPHRCHLRNIIESELFFTTSTAITDIPSEATLRQRMDNQAKAFFLIAEKASRYFLKTIQPDLKLLDTGHIPLDADVIPIDNSGTRKEGVSRAYNGCDGYAPTCLLQTAVR